jgi:hypothetical protein
MKKNLIIIIFLTLISQAFSQGPKLTCFVYRSYSDLLSGNNKLERNYLPIKDDVFAYKTEGSNKEKKFNLKDSGYVGYEICTKFGGFLQSRYHFHQKLGRFTHLLGGNEKYFMTGSGRTASVLYSADGYIFSVSGDQFYSWYFVKMDGDKQTYLYNIIDIIKDDEELVKQYNAEYVNENNVRISRENDFKSDVKYLKLYLDKHK